MRMSSLIACQLAPETVPVGESEPGLAQVVLFALRFFGRRPGWRFGTV